jgi:DNA-binding CsgD family transcriptional regulator
MREFLLGGKARCFVLSGEPGIGKTALWQAGLDVAVSLGFAVLYTRASEAEARLPFAALMDIVDGIDRDVLLDLPAPQSRALDVALRRADPGGRPLDPVALSAAVLTAIRSLAARQPLLVAVDDVQWLDASSADPLIFAARRVAGEVRFLFSRRSPGPPAPLEAALRAGDCETVELAGLSLGAVRGLLAERLGLVLPRRALLQLWEISRGNPLFVLELGRHVAGREFHGADGELPFPHLLEDLLGERIGELAPERRRALLTVSLSAGLRREDLERLVEPLVVEDALSSGLLTSERGSIRAAHPLLAAAALHHSSAAERRQVHLDLASSLSDPTRRTRHLARATAIPDAELAVAVAKAATLAASEGAVEMAQELASHALRLTPAGRPERADRVLELARALLDVGEFPSAEELLRAHLDELPSGTVRARGHVLLGQALDISGEFEQLDLALQEAGEDAELRADVLGRKAVVLAVGQVERVDEAEAWARQALAAARQDGPAVEARVLPALAWTLVLQGDWLKESERADRAQPVSNLWQGSVELPRGARHRFRGEAEEARRILERLGQRAESWGDFRASIGVTMQLCELELRCGYVTAAARLLEELEEWGAWEELGFVHARMRAMMSSLLGQPEAARHWASAVLENGCAGACSGWDRLEATRALGVADLFVGDAQGAVDRLLSVWEHTLRQHVHDPGVFPVAGDLVEALLLSGDSAKAAAVAERLERVAATQAHPWAMATAMRSQALLRLQTGFDHEAARVLEEAASRYGELGYRFDQARSLLVLGRLQRRARKSGDARRSFDQAVSHFEQQGCTGWAEQAGEELARVSGRRPGSEGQLTPSERRVVELAASGMSNKEIASQLFVSVYTVEEHLSNAYPKLGVRSRSQLANLLAPSAPA